MTKLAPFIPNQFPSFYQEEGQSFIQFVQAYYKWLDELEKDFFAIRDIDRTPEEYISHFREKYIRNIQLNPKTNDRLLIKNALSLYRAKGSERAIDLFFKLVYGENASVYYPGDDIFRSSNARWEVPKFFEVRGPNLERLVGKQVKGSSSNALAFVDSFIRQKDLNGNWINTIYVTNVKGSFIVNETINGTLITGSPGTIEITNPGAGFSMGEEYPIKGINSENGVARVASVNESGEVLNFEIVATGFSYTEGEEVQIGAAEGIVHLKAVGNEVGRFRDTEGFLSNDKHIFDGRYYQEYSYEVQSPMSFSEYEEVLKNVLHVAGTEVFGSTQINSIVDGAGSIGSLVEIEE